MTAGQVDQETAAPARASRRGPRNAAGRWSGRGLLALAPILLGLALLAWLGVSYVQSAAHPTVRGQITAVETRDIGHAQTLTVHAADGRDWQFDVDPSVDMTPGHMREHMAFGQPVTVSYRRAGGKLVATQVTD